MNLFYIVKKYYFINAVIILRNIIEKYFKNCTLKNLNLFVV
jgi:hypothetical protein